MYVCTYMCVHMCMCACMDACVQCARVVRGGPDRGTEAENLTSPVWKARSDSRCARRAGHPAVVDVALTRTWLSPQTSERSRPWAVPRGAGPCSASAFRLTATHSRRAGVPTRLQFLRWLLTSTGLVSLPLIFPKLAHNPRTAGDFDPSNGIRQRETVPCAENPFRRALGSDV